MKKEDYHKIGEVIKEWVLMDKKRFVKTQKEVYEYTFSPNIELQQLKKEIELFCAPFLGNEGIFF